MRSLRYFLRSYPGESAIVLACLVLAATAEGLGFSTLMPLLSLATSPEGAAAPTSAFEATVRTQLERVGIEPTLVPLTLVFVATLWLRGAILLFTRRRVGYTVARIATDLRLDLLRALLAARWSYFTRQPVGAAGNAMASEAERASIAFNSLALVAAGVVDAAIYTALALAVSWQATLAATGFALVTVLALSGLVSMAARAGRKQTELLKSLLGRLNDTLQAVKRIKGTGREAAFAELLEDRSLRLNRQLRRRIVAQEGLRTLQEPVVYTLIALGLLVAITAFALPLSSLALLGLLFVRTLSRLSRVQRKYQTFLMEESALWSMRDMIERAEYEVERSGDRAPTLERGIELRGVHVTYDEATVLEDVDLEIPARGITALVGTSGSGKTTIVDLIMGLVQPSAGEVRIDGVPLPEIDLHRWRRCVGYVPQEVTLLNETIRVNVTLGDPALTEADVQSALRTAGAWEFVSQLPEGIDTVVGERGSLFSGGQRQRIGIAGALVHRPKLLILDEATAALDAESEDRIWESVQELAEHTTVIAISHQPALIRVADRIYRVAESRVACETAAPRTRDEKDRAGRVVA